MKLVMTVQVTLRLSLTQPNHEKWLLINAKFITCNYSVGHLSLLDVVGGQDHC